MDCTTSILETALKGVNCILCSKAVPYGTTVPINEHQARCLSLVLNFQTSSSGLSTTTVTQNDFLYGNPCITCQHKLIEVESLAEDWELLRDRLKTTAWELRQILDPEGPITSKFNYVATATQSKESVTTEDDAKVSILKKLYGDDRALYEPFLWLPKFSMHSEHDIIVTPGLEDDPLASIDNELPKDHVERLRTEISFDHNYQTNAEPSRKRKRDEHFTSQQQAVRPSLKQNPTDNIPDFGNDVIDKTHDYCDTRKVFTIAQLDMLSELYEKHKKILGTSRFDDPNVEVRQLWEVVAKMVSQLRGPTKSPATCWRRMQVIIRMKTQQEAESYTVECPNGAKRLKHCQLNIEKCDDPQYVILRKNQPDKKQPGQSSSSTNSYPPVENFLTCSFDGCSYKCVESDRLDGHYNSRHLNDPSPYKCPLSDCGKTFVTYIGLRSHSGIHSGHFPFSCEGCSRKFINKSRFKRHKCQKHKGTPDYQCHMCDKAFFLYIGLKSHIQRVHKDKAIKCPASGCNEVFNFQTQLETHCRVKHLDELPDQNLPRCPECGKICDGESNFKQHMLKHEGLLIKKDTRRFACVYQDCKTKTPSAAALRRHVQIVHETIEKNVFCTFEGCGAAFKTEQGRDKHAMRMHYAPGQGPRNYECNICGLRLRSARAVETHIASQHRKGSKDYICERCARGFSAKRYFIRHQRLYPDCEPEKPPGPNAVQCELCESYCSNLAGLRRHYVLLHKKNEEKPWKCPWCGNGYPIKMYLTRHKTRCKKKPKIETTENPIQGVYVTIIDNNISIENKNFFEVGT